MKPMLKDELLSTGITMLIVGISEEEQLMIAGALLSTIAPPF
jgi:hypothetical protein